MEEIVLEAKDACDWVYRGEGAANLVLAYTGCSARFVGKVLRVQKVNRNGSEPKDGASAFTGYACLLWKDIHENLSASTWEVQQRYAQHVMRPLLGFEHIDAGIRVLVTSEFLESVRQNILLLRPSWRVDEAEVNTLCDSALLISDHSIFPHGIAEEEVCISVEIKPKCGFLPTSRFIAEENAIKRSVTRFRMHQTLKFYQRKISQTSEYDPLDMFSGNKSRVLKSVKDLFATPHNNFRVFMNGALIFGGLGGTADSADIANGQAFEDALKCVIQSDDGTHTTNFLQLVAGVISKSGVVDKLLEAQKLDKFDIEGAIHAYYDVVSQPCLVCKELGDIRADRYASLHSIPFVESLRIVRDYLIAATAKDLSLMLTFRPRDKLGTESLDNVVFLESSNQTFDYKASFIDLDMKPLEKMVYYHELDQQIVGYYSRMVKAAHQPVVNDSCQHVSCCDEGGSRTKDSSVLVIQSNVVKLLSLNL